MVSMRCRLSIRWRQGDKMISIREVAQLAGVSASTVSRVMNGTAKVDPEKKEDQTANYIYFRTLSASILLFAVISSK